MLTKSEVEIRHALNIVTAMIEDIEGFEENWPKSKRGSRQERHWNRLKERRDALEQCISGMQCKTKWSR